ncbi:MAG: hypothetical protein SF051_16455 [Elusimicrobiota bacterium]|nr:hypothetical protein [Elusimicrobiota bacterium]
MTRISCTRFALLAFVFAASLGAAACDQQGCGGAEEEASTKAEEIVCGAGTHLQGGQCVATQGVTTR